MLLLGWLAASTLLAQSKPNFFPEDVTSENVELRCFCKPGIRNKSRSKGLDITYGGLGAGTFKPESAGLNPPYSQYRNWRQLAIGLRIPLINHDHFKVLIGLNYNQESFDISSVGVDFSEVFQTIDLTRLKENSLGLIISKPLNETRYLAFRLRYSASGNFAGLMDFSQPYAIYQGIGLYGIKPDEDHEWGIGLSFSHSFRRTSLFPFILYNRNFNQHWGIEAVFPSYVFGRRNLKTGTILLFGGEYNSESYRLTAGKATIKELNYALNHSEVRALFRLEQRLSSWIWADVKAGYQMNFSTDFEAKRPALQSFQVEPENGFFLRLGLFLSPPSEKHDYY